MCAWVLGFSRGSLNSHAGATTLQRSELGETRRVPHPCFLRVGLGFLFHRHSRPASPKALSSRPQCRASCGLAQFVIPTEATAPFAVAQWRDRGTTPAVPRLNVRPLLNFQLSTLQPLLLSPLAGCPRHGVCAWVLGFSSTATQAPPHQRNCHPDRSNGSFCRCAAEGSRQVPIRLAPGVQAGTMCLGLGFPLLRLRTLKPEGAPSFAPFAKGGFLRPNTTISLLLTLAFDFSVDSVTSEFFFCRRHTLTQPPVCMSLRPMSK